ncbi:MAG: NAD-dependent epimerase/dehydratase family protein [Acidobacteria bacterium]|nr:NAD-dependent epimerase/dehydratase family protein [Acidobacteriota bacterium]
MGAGRRQRLHRLIAVVNAEKGESLKILVTGGAGFIGSHIVDALIAAGHEVRVLDALVAQVHGSRDSESTRPPYLHTDAELVQGDICDAALIEQALEGVEAVFHQAAEVGVGQSMYEITRYVDANTRGTAILLQALIRRRRHIRKLVVASSMSIYGEGACECRQCGPVAPPLRSAEQLGAHEWEVRCPGCGREVRPSPTRETKPLFPGSVYAITKQDQEQLSLVLGRAYGIPTIALRYWNVYGARQALSNPYTGVCAIFSARLLNGQPPLIFEDGCQLRDFVHIRDIVQANLLALESPDANYHAINIGSGEVINIRQVAQMLAEGLGRSIAPIFPGKSREGDIRRCIPDLTRARSVLGYKPQVTLAQGIPELLDWVRSQTARDSVETATAELAARQLVR